MNAVFVLTTVLLVLLAWRKGYLHDFYEALQGQWTV